MSRLEDYTLVPRCSFVHDSPCLPLEQETSPCIQEVDTLIGSDLYLGSDLSRPVALLGTLQRYTFRRLIFLGDIFDDLNFREA